MYKQLVERSGEAKAMIFCNLVAIFAISLQLVELKVGYLLIGRVIQGVVIGILSCILPLYLNSIAPIPISGKICSLNQIMICLGVITAYLVGFFIPEDKDDEVLWRLVVGFPILPSLVSIVGFMWLFPFDNLERHLEKGEDEPLQKYLRLVYKNATVEDIRR
jgi:MFS family permease